MKDLEKAKQILLNGEYTCVLCKGEEITTSTLRGVKPLVLLTEDDVCYSGYSAADKVIGKATAFLYIIMEVKAVYARVISRPALDILNENNIIVEYERLTDNIINRQGDGICPFEEAVSVTENIQTAYKIIIEKLQKQSKS